MNKRQQGWFESLRRVIQFGDTYDSLFPEGSAGRRASTAARMSARTSVTSPP